ncbi:MAG TPA: hypothetical protein PLC98_11415 [Anaerolineales bacterium]|nr:hypothetical protein [Anaerolineales bacterium]
MLLSLVSIEWIRLMRRWLPWAALLLCTVFSGLSLHNFYVLSAADFASGAVRLPGLSFDLATALDQTLVLGAPFIVVFGAVLIGDDFAQRTNQHWLIRASRTTSLLAKFATLALLILAWNSFTVLAGGAFGLGYKFWLTGAFNLAGVNWLQLLWALFYMTIVCLPYGALALLLALLTRSTFLGAAIGFGYALVVENLVGAVFARVDLVRWLPRSLYLSATYMLNHIGDRTVEVPAVLHQPLFACLVAAAYAVVLLGFAILWYRRQDVGG